MPKFSPTTLRKSAEICLTVSNDGAFYAKHIKPTFTKIGQNYRNDPANYSPTFGTLHWATIVEAAIVASKVTGAANVRNVLARHLEAKWREATYQAMGIAVSDIPSFVEHDNDIASDYEY
jgi:hypothetical protein